MQRDCTCNHHHFHHHVTKHHVVISITGAAVPNKEEAALTSNVICHIGASKAELGWFEIGSSQICLNPPDIRSIQYYIISWNERNRSSFDHYQNTESLKYHFCDLYESPLKVVTWVIQLIFAIIWYLTMFTTTAAITSKNFVSFANGVVN